MSETLGITVVPDETTKAVERVYREWDRAWSDDDLDAMIALYAPDAILESPLVPHLQGGTSGVLKGGSRSAISSTKRRRANPASAPSIVAAISPMAGCWFGSIRAPRLMVSRWTFSKSWKSWTASSSRTGYIGDGVAWRSSRRTRTTRTPRHRVQKRTSIPTHLKGYNNSNSFIVSPFQRD